MTAIAMFTEHIHCRKVVSRNKTRGVNAEDDWGTRIWLGLSQRTSEHYVGTPMGVVKASTAVYMPEEQRWYAQ